MVWPGVFPGVALTLVALRSASRAAPHLQSGKSVLGLGSRQGRLAQSSKSAGTPAHRRHSWTDSQRISLNFKEMDWMVVCAVWSEVVSRSKFLLRWVFEGYFGQIWFRRPNSGIRARGFARAWRPNSLYQLEGNWTRENAAFQSIRRSVTGRPARSLLSGATIFPDDQDSVFSRLIPSDEASHRSLARAWLLLDWS